MRKRILKTLTDVVLIFAWVISPFAQTETVEAASNLDGATAISFGTIYKGSITETVDTVAYKFTLASSGSVTLNSTANMRWVEYCVYDASGDKIWSTTEYWNSVSEVSTTSVKLDLVKGTYYFCVSESDSTGTYQFKLTYSSAGESFVETQSSMNNSLATANAITLGKTYKGQIADNDEKDFYKFSISSDMVLNLNATANIHCVNYYLYDSSGSEVKSMEYIYWDDTTEVSVTDEDLVLSKGTYYFCVCQPSYSSYTGNYSFCISQKKYVQSIGFKKTMRVMKQGKTYNPYTSISPSGATNKTLSWSTSDSGVATVDDNGNIKAVGAGTATVTASATDGSGVTKSIHIVVKPKKMKISRISYYFAGLIKNKFSVSLKSQSGVSGYQYKISRKKKMKKVKAKNSSFSSFTTDSLKYNKKYYIKARAYVKYKGKKYYGAWSKVKKKKTGK